MSCLFLKNGCLKIIVRIRIKQTYKKLKKYSTVRKGTVPYGKEFDRTNYEQSRTVRLRESNHVPLVSQANHLVFRGLRLFIPVALQFKRMHV